MKKKYIRKALIYAFLISITTFFVLEGILFQSQAETVNEIYAGKLKAPSEYFVRIGDELISIPEDKIEPVVIEGVDAFAHLAKDGWRVTEKLSGLALTLGMPTKKEAVEEAARAVRESIDVIGDVIREMTLDIIPYGEAEKAEVKAEAEVEDARKARQEEEKRKESEQEARVTEERRLKKEEAAKKILEDKKRREEERQARMEEKKRKEEERKARLEKEKKEREEARLKKEEEKKQKDEERKARMEEKKRKREEEIRKREEERKARLEEKRLKDEETKSNFEAKRRREEEEKAISRLKDTKKLRAPSEYFIRINSRLTPISKDKVEPITIKGLDAFIHKADDGWRITEKRSGLALTTGRETKEKAVERATAAVEDNIEEIENIIANASVDIIPYDVILKMAEMEEKKQRELEEEKRKEEEAERKRLEEEKKREEERKALLEERVRAREEKERKKEEARKKKLEEKQKREEERKARLEEERQKGLEEEKRKKEEVKAKLEEEKRKKKEEERRGENEARARLEEERRLLEEGERLFEERLKREVEFEAKLEEEKKRREEERQERLEEERLKEAEEKARLEEERIAREQEKYAADGVSAKDKLSMKISLDYKDADLLTVLRSLSWTYKLNIVTTPDIRGKVTISLQDVSVKEALGAIITINGLTYNIRGNIIYISPGDVEAVELISGVIFLKYLKAADAQNLLRKVVSSKGDIKIDEVANSIIVTDYPSSIQKVEDLLDKVDIAPRQVLIEAKIVDITSNDLKALGVTWNVEYAPGHGLFDRATSFSEQLDTTITMGEQSSDLTGSQIALNELTFKGLSFSATLDALVRDGKANILASPSIAVLNGQEARIIIGERYPYKERTQTTTGTTETTKFVDIGTTLRVTPQINDDGYITMRVHPEVSSLAAALDAGPRVTTREADTTVRVKEGETLVIGGLIKQTDEASVDKVPYLGDIPILGYLFKRREHDIERKELAVFITPTILYSREEKTRLGKKAAEKQEVFVSLKETGELAMVEEIFKSAKAIDEGRGIESVRKDANYRKSQALSLYEHIYYEYPDSMRAPEALYSAGKIYYQHLKDYQQAKRTFAHVASDYPKSPFAKKAKDMYKEIEKEEKNGKSKRRR